MTDISPLIKLSRTRGTRSLDFFLQLNELFDQPYKSFPAIHVAGTNGKGSVCLKIATALEKSGYKVGLYTSPHLFFFEERIQVNRKLIPEKELAHLSLQILEAAKSMEREPTFFETLTLASFLYFKQQKVDVAVIETGLGGKLDATNIITPLISVITSIGHDHMDILGDTIEKIGSEKAGIIKDSVPVVLGPTCDISTIHQEAQRKGSPLYLIKGPFRNYDEENSAVAKQALMLLKESFNLTDKTIEEGIACRPSCRFEMVGGVIYDVAHNLEGISKLLEWLSQKVLDKKYVFLSGFSKDKEIVECLKIMSQKAHAVYLSPTTSESSATCGDLQNIINDLKSDNIFVFSSTFEAVKEANKFLNDPQYQLIVTGSFYIMQSARSALQQLRASRVILPL